MLLILALVLVFPNKKILKEFLRIDTIFLSLSFFVFIVIISYIINIPNATLVSKTFSSNSGESPSFLYLKIMLNGVIFCISAILAYLLGRTISLSKVNFFKLYQLLFGFCLLNGFVNVVAWIITTGGSIGRYNFEPPITFSPGISILYSSIGFLIGLSILARIEKAFKRKLFIVALSILLLSVLIIQTRQSQLSFVIMCMLYFFKTHKFSVKTFFWLVPSFIIFSILILIIFKSSSALESYGDIDSTDSVDVAIRLLMLNSAYEIFLAHPVFGIGYGMFVGHNTIPIIITGVPVYLASPHNGIAAILCELGLAGIITLFVITFFIIKKLNKALKLVKDPILKKYCISVYVIQVVLLISVFLSNSSIFGPPAEISYLYISFLSFFMIGSVIGISRNESQIVTFN